MPRTSEPQPMALKCPQCGGSLPPSAAAYAVCQFCGSSLILSTPATPDSAPPATAVRGIRLKPFACTDRDGTGLELFRMLVPVGWEFQGGCRWLLDNPGMPAVVNFQVFNPSGAEAFEVLPNINFTWNNNPMAAMMQPVGSRYFGGGSATTDGHP
jgi:hypothetical protein